jgi:molecular chaperone GrpE
MIPEGNTNNAPGDEAAPQETSTKQAPGNDGNAAQGASVEELQAKLQDAEKKYLYLYSEFENFRRRNERERLDFLKFGHEGFLKELLQVMDNFERALSHAKSLAGEKGSPLGQVSQGIEMIHHQFSSALKEQGVSAIQAVGLKFDPALHEAVGEEAADSEAGTVIKEAQKGYLLYGRLLRPARVVLVKARG